MHIAFDNRLYFYYNPSFRYHISMDVALNAFIEFTNLTLYVIDESKFCQLKHDRIVFLDPNSQEFQILTNSFVFCSFFQDISRFSPILTKESGIKIMNIWHGMPLRTIGFDDFYEKDFDEIIIMDGYQDFIEHFVCSPLYKDVFSKAFKTCKDKIHCIGNLRSSAKQKDFGLKDLGAKIICFAPTANNFLGSHSISQQLGLSTSDLELNNLFRENNIILIYKEHSGKFNKLNDKLYSNIRPISEADMDAIGVQIANFQGDVDLFISDYSSLIVDFLYVNVPVLCIAPESYSIKNRKFIVDRDILYSEFFSSENEFVNLILNKINAGRNDPYSCKMRKEIQIHDLRADYLLVSKVIELAN